MLLLLLLLLSLVTGLFFLVLLLNQRWSPPLTIPVTDCSTVHTIMCDVPSVAVFCSESTESFPGTASKCFLKAAVSIPVAPIITGIILHFMFHIRCISTHKLFFSSSICTTFLSAGIATSISMPIFSSLFSVTIFCLFVVTSLSACTAYLLLLLLVATTCFSCSPPDLNLVVTNFMFGLNVK